MLTAGTDSPAPDSPADSIFSARQADEESLVPMGHQIEPLSLEHMGNGAAETPDELRLSSPRELVAAAAEDDPAHNREQTVSPFGVFFNLTNTTIGAGVLALPFAVSKAGIVLGPILLVVVAILSTYTLQTLLSASNILEDRVNMQQAMKFAEFELQAEPQLGELEQQRQQVKLHSSKPHPFSYKGLAVAAYGQWAGVLFEACIFLLCIGILVAYSIIEGEYLGAVVRAMFSYESNDFAPWYLSDKFMVAITALVITFPLSCLRNLHVLGMVSTAAILSVLFVLIAVVVRFIETASTTNYQQHLMERITFVPDGLGLFYALPSFFFAYSSHINLLPLYAEMKGRSPRKMTGIIATSTIACAAVYALMSISGYLTFFDKTPGNVLNGYATSDILMLIARGCIYILICFSYPLIHFAARQCIEHVFFHTYHFRWSRWIIEAAVICSLVICTALLVPNISDILGLTGSTMTVLVMYVFPQVLYIKFKREDRKDRLRKPKVIFALGTVIVCLTIGGSCLVAVILSMIEKYTKTVA